MGDDAGSTVTNSTQEPVTLPDRLVVRGSTGPHHDRVHAGEVLRRLRPP